MSAVRWRAALVPLRAVMHPSGALLETRAGSEALVILSLLALVAMLGALGLPRLLSLLAGSLAPGRTPLLDAHAAVLHAGLARYVVADRLLPPLPYLFAAALAAVAAAPLLAERGVRAATVACVLAAGAAPLLLQRLGELAVVWLTPADALASGEIVGLPTRFNVGVAGVLAAAGVTPAGALGVAAEAANAVGVWVTALWGLGIAGLARGEAAAARGAALPVWPFALTAAAYAAGWAVYAKLFPFLVIVVMGRP